ncbi:MAG: hypothetical protein RL660_2250 [Bacteroidota bacterium]|jgi:hypothetical protein
MLALVFNNYNALAQASYTIAFTDKAIAVDGNATDAAWQNIAATDIRFIQTQPKFMAESEYKTQVRLCYSATGIYVLAEMFQDKATILTQLTERDRIGEANADNFSVYFDTYLDHQNGFAFKVSSANVQQDEKLIGGGAPGGMGGGSGGDADISWDAVWESAVSILPDRWVAEMYIPFSAIRMPSTPEQTWGLNFRRQVRSVNEASFWNSYDPNKAGFLLQEGVLKGLKDIKTPLRLGLFPYLSSGIQSLPSGGDRNNLWLKSGGLDLKYGLSDAFTLDMSLVPDFSQVVSDNLIRNLSPFEQQLQENRPFFTEGVELFNKMGMFYSRRIGQRPDNFYDIESEYSDTSKFSIEKNPNVSTLYNTFKVSGRTKSNLGIGVFNALQAPAKARIRSIQGDSTFTQQTSNLTNYNMVVLDQALPHQSYICFTNANTLRFNGGRKANVTGVQTELLNKAETHKLFFGTNLSAIFENNTDKPLLGNWLISEYSKIEGKFQWLVGGEYYGKNFDQTDMGIQFDYNNLELRMRASYRENKPKAKFLNLYRTWFNHNMSFNVVPFASKSYEFETGLFWLFKNFVDVTVYAGGEPFGIKDFYQLERFNRPINVPGYVYFGTSGSSDSRKKFFGYWDLSYGDAYQRKGFTYTEISNGYRYRVNDHFQFGSGFRCVWNHANLGRTNYYYSINNPIAAFRHVNEYSWDINAQYNFNANSNITARFRHYNSFINTKQLYLVDENGNWEASPIAMLPDLNENFNLQNIDIFYNWIFKPGSRLIVSYKQWLSDAYLLNDKFENQKFVQNVYQVNQEPRAFLLAARMIWYIDYNELRRK